MCFEPGTIYFPFQCVEALLEAGKASGIDLDIKNENGHCALMEAASGGRIATRRRPTTY